VLGESASIVAAPADADADAVLNATAEAWLRLASGRLAPEHTPASTRVVVLEDGQPVQESDAVTLDTLRAVFPGF